MKKFDGNINSPLGYETAGGHMGLKKIKKDMALLVCKDGCIAAGCFTSNKVKAAPVLWDMQNIKNKIYGIVINSGNANACTGEQGLADSQKTAEELAGIMNVKAENILVASTGVIGVRLDIDKILKGVQTLYTELNASDENGLRASEAIMTTDTVIKTAAAEIEVDGKRVSIGATAKGSGMINPNMATMLCFITTDADISGDLLNKALKSCVEDTFNMISVDGDTSTNDTVIILANGKAGNTPITEENENYSSFKQALLYVTRTLAIACVSDGEGATKLMEVTVKGAKCLSDARKLANSVVSSNLFKAALFGEDANWGRAICAMGYSGVDFNPNEVSITFRSAKGDLLLMDKGTPIEFDEEKAAEILSEHDIFIDILLYEGSSEATAWGCDLTYEYVKINGDYRS